MVTDEPDEVAALLVAARRALAGGLELPRPQRTRAAALLARTALERLVAHRLAERGHRLVPRTPIRSRLICFTVLCSQTDGSLATTAYAALSTACHHHAYELSPTAWEVEHWLRVVEDLAEPGDVVVDIRGAPVSSGPRSSRRSEEGARRTGTPTQPRDS